MDFYVSLSVFPEVYLDPAKLYGSDRIRIQNTVFIYLSFIFLLQGSPRGERVWEHFCWPQRYVNYFFFFAQREAAIYKIIIFKMFLRFLLKYVL